MSITSKRLIILAVVIAAAFVLGRLAVRAALNLLLGGTLFGGIFRCKTNRKGGGTECFGDFSM